MEFNPTASLSTARLTRQDSPLSPTLSSPSGSLLIRAPLSSDDNTASSDDGGFLTASDPDDAVDDSDVELRAEMPIAQLTGGDDDDDVFEEELTFEGEEGDFDGNPSLVEGGDVGQIETSPTGDRNPVESPKDEILGVGEKEIEESEQEEIVAIVRVPSIDQNPSLVDGGDMADVGQLETPPIGDHNTVEITKDEILGVGEKEIKESEREEIVDGLPAIVRVPSSDQNPSLLDGGDMGDVGQLETPPIGDRNLVEGPKDEILGVVEKEIAESEQGEIEVFDGHPAIARVPSIDQNSSLVDGGEVFDDEMDKRSTDMGDAVQLETPSIGDSGEIRNPVEGPKDKILGVPQKEIEESELEASISEKIARVKAADRSVSEGEKDECLGGVSDEKLEGVEESKHRLPEADDVEVLKTGEADVVSDSNQNLEQEDTILNNAVGTEGANSLYSIVEAVEEIKENRVIDAKDEKTEILGVGAEESRSPVVRREENFGGSEESKHGASDDDAVEIEKTGDSDIVADSNENRTQMSFLASETPKLESSESNALIDVVENCEGSNGGSIAMVSEIADVSFCQLDDEKVKKDDSFCEGSAVCAENLHIVHGDNTDVKSVTPVEVAENAKLMVEPLKPSIDFDAETVEPLSELAVDGGDSISIHEVESLPKLSKQSRSIEIEAYIPEISVVTENWNLDVVPREDSVTNVGEEHVSYASNVADNDEEKTNPNSSDDDDVGEEEVEINLVSEGPARVAILESSETAKQIIKDFEGGSSSTSTRSGFGSTHDFLHNLDGQIASDSEEELLDTDGEGDGKELFDSAKLAELLRAATGGSTDGSRIFTVDPPVGLGSSIPSLKPFAPRSTRPSLLQPSDLAVAPEPDMDDDERKLHDKVELIRVKFLRLVHRLGYSPDDSVAAQVIYRLGLAEGLRRGKQAVRNFSTENARKKATELENDNNDELDFSCNILVLGKAGVGKSATINSIFRKEKSLTNAFDRATESVKVISGVVDGVKIRVIDTPGLRVSVMDQASNKRILQLVKKYTKRYTPDIVLYVDRMDTQTRDLNDLPLLKSITSILGSSIWFNAIVALTHAASAPPDGPNGQALSYDMFVAQRSHVVQHSIRQAAGDMRLMNPVALVENHSSCRRNREGETILPNGLSWRPQMLLLCYSSKILSEANSLLKLQDNSPGKLFGFRLRSPPLPFLLSSLLQSKPHPKLSGDQGGDHADSDVDFDDLSDKEDAAGDEEEDYDELPPFKPLRKSQIAKLTKEQKRAYFDEYDYRAKLLQKKQWKEELRRMREMKKRGKAGNDDLGYGDGGEDFDQDNAPASVPVPLPDMVLPPSFDCDSSAYRYRFLEPTSQVLVRPVLDTHGWDHDCGYDGVSLEQNLAVLGRLPAGLAVQVTKDKKEFNIHLDSSIAVKHGENGSSLAGFDIQSVGKQLAYILRGETKVKNLKKKNKTAAGISVTFLGETIATGFKVEDILSIGKRVGLVASAGTVRAQGESAYGANLEARIRDKDYPLGQALSTLGLSLMRWRGDLAVGANAQSQFPVGRSSRVVVRVGLNNKMSGQVSIRTSSSEQLQIALVGVLPIAVSIYRSIWPGEPISY